MRSNLYIRLAGTIREAKALRSERANAERDASLQKGAVPLNAMLNFLDSEAGRAVVTSVQSEIDAGLRSLDALPRTPYTIFASQEDSFKRTDPLLQKLVAFFDQNYENKAAATQVPRAVVSAFAAAASTGGLLDEARVEKTLGARGVSLFKLICGQMQSEPTTRPKLKFDGLDYDVSDKVARSAGRQTFIARMPLLKEVTQTLGGPDALKGFTIASVQHLFPSTAALYDELTNNGANRSLLRVGGKNYSSNPNMTARMQADGFDVNERAKPRPEPVGLNSEHEIYAMAKSELRALFDGCDPKTETKRRFLLLDEGGKLLKALHQDFPQYAHLCVAVEQTDRGIQVVEALEKQGMPLLCPLVNSARSVTKKQIVAPMIGESVVFHAEHELHSVNPKLRIEPKVATIIGYGSVGKATADALRLRGYTIHVYDVDPTKMEQARRDGCTATTREDALRNAHSLYSCTGVTAVTREDYALLPDHAVLVNAASGNHELDLHDLPPSFFSDHDADLQVDGDQRASSSFKGERAALGDLGGGEAMLNRVLRVNGKELLVVRSGYVVNMTLGLPPEYVQLELSMLLASCLQAVNETEPGLVDVDPNTQKLLQSRARTHLKRIGHALEQPDFRSLPIWQLA